VNYETIKKGIIHRKIARLVLLYRKVKLWQIYHPTLKPV